MEAYRDISIYDLKSYFLLVGRTKSSTFFKLLKIRKLSSSLEIQEVKRAFNKQELEKYLRNILHENAMPVFTAEVLLGVTKFLQGYYLYLVKKKIKIAKIRGNSIYQITSAELFKLFPDKESKEEKRYIDIFYTLDLQLGFFFSYSYDLTHTLQENIKTILSASSPERRARAKTFHSLAADSPDWTLKQAELYDWKTTYVWNHDMISSLFPILTDKNWIVPMIHGFVGYRSVMILGRKYDIVVIARRSRHFAGTRYLKRGLNEEGKVANDVETEQMVIEKIQSGKITAFVQHRGSVPLFWCQDPTSMLPSPPIILNQNDFLRDSTIRHFGDMFQRYGTPVIIINLLRVNIDNKEYYLSEEYKNTITYLNKSISPDYQIEYNSFDIKNEIKKGKKTYEEKFYNEFKGLIKKTSIFSLDRVKDGLEAKFQVGVIRTNCVDCIDRTNEGQLLISHLALEEQLKTMGICGSLSMKSDIVQLLTKMFEEMGDVIALQYSGSIAHKATNSKVKKKQSKLLVATQRHLANLIKDSKKQQAINLFLGIYKTDLHPIHLWDISDDFRLHNKVLFTTRIHGKWWKNETFKFLQRLGIKKPKSLYQYQAPHDSQNFRILTFAFNKNLLVGTNSTNITSFDKKSLWFNSELIELMIQEESVRENQPDPPIRSELKKINTLSEFMQVNSEEINLFKEYVGLEEVNAIDNFHIAIVNEEIHLSTKIKCDEDFDEYLNTKSATRKFLKDFESDDDSLKEPEPEIKNTTTVIDYYLDEYQPPAYFKCLHFILLEKKF